MLKQKDLFKEIKKPETKIKKFFSSLGPGLVTGAADDDPSGIVTYSQSGAKFGLGQLWTVIFMLPLMVAVQELCARIGMVTGKGLARILKEHYAKPVVFGMILLLLIANTINLGADFGAMAEATRLFIDLPYSIIIIGFFALILVLEITVPYHKYARILKWLTISLLAYFLTGIIAGGNWGEIFKSTFIPRFDFSLDYLFIIVGVLGTTISPYMFFWESSQEVEEREDHYLNTHKASRVTRRSIANMRMDNLFGMIFSEMTTWFIIVTTASVLHKNGVFDIRTAADAAKALEPLVQSFPNAGTAAKVLFASGVIGTGLLAIPIFAATSAYALSELFNWQEGLANKFKDARNFYIVIIVGILIGLLINLIGIDPIKALVYSAVINGVIAVPMIFMIIKIGNNKKIMGKYVSRKWSRLLTTLTFVGMGLAALAMLYTSFV